ncbi:pyridoxine 5'-phosphate oxidase C-terminal domain-containing protein [Pseudochrobactrum kiredjianiae]|uniref:Pyridoxine 5'-phosphate oxidase C-terminal domain-containing protein n=1 Tax=Pseudochrobactrum kiredjianiae TaxID=386305 RepID=A0ABW3V099_9HYPH
MHEAELFLINNPRHVSEVWQVYAVNPDRVEFLQGAADRAHKRPCYDATVNPLLWKTVRLWP